MVLSEDPSPRPHAEPAGDTTAPPLLLCWLSGALPAEIETLLAAEPRIRCTGPLAQFVPELQAQPDAPAVVLYDAAIPALLAAFDRDASAGAALRDWTGQAEALLQAQARDRRRILLVEARSALRYADVFAARLGLSAQLAEKLAALPLPAPDPVALSLARAALQDDPAARRTAARLLAATTEFSNSGPETDYDLDAAFERYRELRAQVSALRTEMERSLLQEVRLGEDARVQAEEVTRRQQLVDELRRSVERMQALETETLLRKDEIARIGEERDRLSRSHAELEQSLRRQSDRLEVERVQGREAREELARIRARSAELEGRLTHAETWLQGILASRSYRLMAPLRRLRARLKRKA